MTTDWKALCVELTEYLALLDEPPGELVVRAQAALSEPKPPSLKVQALEALDEEHADMRIQNYKLIRSVLESLPD